MAFDDNRIGESADLARNSTQHRDGLTFELGAANLEEGRPFLVQEFNTESVFGDFDSYLVLEPLQFRQCCQACPQVFTYLLEGLLLGFLAVEQNPRCERK